MINKIRTMVWDYSKLSWTQNVGDFKLYYSDRTFLPGFLNDCDILISYGVNRNTHGSVIALQKKVRG